MSKRPLATLWQCFTVHIHILPDAGRFYLASAHFSNGSCASHMQLCAVVVCKLSLKPKWQSCQLGPRFNIKTVFVMLKKNDRETVLSILVSRYLYLETAPSIRPVILELILQLSDRGLSREETSRCHLPSPTWCSWDWQNYPEAGWDFIEERHMKGDHALLLIIRRKRFLLVARFMGPTWGPSGADRTQVGPMLAPWTLLSGIQPDARDWLKP